MVVLHSDNILCLTLSCTSARKKWFPYSLAVAAISCASLLWFLLTMLICTLAKCLIRSFMSVITPHQGDLLLPSLCSSCPTVAQSVSTIRCPSKYLLISSRPSRTAEASASSTALHWCSWQPQIGMGFLCDPERLLHPKLLQSLVKMLHRSSALLTALVGVSIG
mgnify:CR=1 FL=1